MIMSPAVLAVEAVPRLHGRGHARIVSTAVVGLVAVLGRQRWRRTGNRLLRHSSGIVSVWLHHARGNSPLRLLRNTMHEAGWGVWAAGPRTRMHGGITAGSRSMTLQSGLHEDMVIKS